MFLVGFYVGSNIAYIILINAKEDYGSNTETILLIVSIVVGLLAGALLSCCFFLAVFLLGALLGYMAAIWFLAWADNGVIQSDWGRAILIVCCVVVGALLMFFFERFLIIVATSFIGSFVIFIGIDLYAQTGFADAVKRFLQARSTDVLIQSSSGVRGMLGGTLALAIVGIFVQYCAIHRRQPPVWSETYPMRAGWRRV